MIIDLHTHIFPPHLAGKALAGLSPASNSLPFTDGTAEGLRRSMKEAGADFSVILPVATSEGQVEKINDYAAGINEQYEGKELLSFGAMHPDFTNFRQELARLEALGIRGIKIHPAYQDTDLDDIRYLRIYERAAELGLLVLTHAGMDIGFPGVVRCSPIMARHVMETLGSFPFILAHMGGWENWEDVPKTLADTGVYLDTSFSIGARRPLDHPELRISLLEDSLAMEIIRAFGPERILFGSDSPWSSQKESLDALKRLPLPESDLEKICGGNARKLLKL